MVAESLRWRWCYNEDLESPVFEISRTTVVVIMQGWSGRIIGGNMMQGWGGRTFGVGIVQDEVAEQLVIPWGPRRNLYMTPGMLGYRFLCRKEIFLEIKLLVFINPLLNMWLISFTIVYGWIRICSFKNPATSGAPVKVNPGGPQVILRILTGVRLTIQETLTTINTFWHHYDIKNGRNKYLLGGYSYNESSWQDSNSFDQHAFPARSTLIGA